MIIMDESIIEIIIKMGLSLVVAGSIGFEREMNQSSAGLKTHILVGISATLIALLQLEAIEFAMDLSSSHVSADPVRLIAQVISGIGFLGAGAIIVTNRTIQGLTTAASIWSVAAIGLAIGLGSYWIAIIGFIFIIGTLILFKRVFIIKGPESIVVKYLQKPDSSSRILEIFKNEKVEFETVRMNIDVINDQLLVTQVFHLKKYQDYNFERLVQNMLETGFVVSIERTNIE